MFLYPPPSPLQAFFLWSLSSCLENPMDGGAWKAAVHGVAGSWTRLRDFTFTFHFHAWEKEMATHSSVLAWRIPGTGEPGRLQSLGSHRVGHDWSDLAAAATESFAYFNNRTSYWIIVIGTALSLFCNWYWWVPIDCGTSSLIWIVSFFRDAV